MRGKTNSVIPHSNQNLLDNPWFTINQRGETTWNGNGYTVDRWVLWNKTEGNMTVTLNEDCTITIQANVDTNACATFYQKIEHFDLGKTYTLSILLADGTIKSLTKIFNSTSDAVYVPITPKGRVYLSYSPSNKCWVTTIGFLDAGESVTIKAVKIEVGAASTLHLDTTPNYSEELLKCQRYFKRINVVGHKAVGIGTVMSNNEFHFGLFENFNMRATPSISYKGQVYARVGSTSGQYNAVSLTSMPDYFIMTIAETVTLKPMESVVIWICNGYIDLWANL